MARIYYNKEELSGKSIDTSIINLDTFQYIKDNTDKTLIEIPPINHTFLRIKLKQTPTFNYLYIRRDNFEYKTSEGTFFLPDALIFYDLDDAPFPSEFYFIARIKDKVELRKCIAGPGIEWFQIPDLHTDINEKAIITKIENTLLQAQKLVKSIYNINIENERKRKLQEERIEKEKTKPYLNQQEKAAYQKIVDICLTNKKIKSKINHFIDNLKSYDKYETLNSVISYLDSQNIYLIITLDWKAEIEDLEWNIQSFLKQNFVQDISLPQPEDFDDNITVSHDDVFVKFDNKLRQNNLQISFIDTEADEYVIIIHSIKNKKEIEEAIHKIGYNYQEVGSL